MSQIAKIVCPCGGTFSDADTTAAEEAAHGCGRPGCCAGAWVCGKCGQRLVVAYEAPELDDRE